MKVLCHRGIDFDQNTTESSLESFEQVLKTCDGLEFDLQMSNDGEFYIWHDQNGDRLTDGALMGPLADRDFSEISQHAKAVNPICSWGDMESLIAKNPDKLFALHLKGANQIPGFLKGFEKLLSGNPSIHPSLLVFDGKKNVVEDLSMKFPELPLALSVAHSYDIRRFNSVTSETLYPVEESLKFQDKAGWAWLDEWDLKDQNGSKDFYSQEVVEAFKSKGMNVAVVSPELHATSPGLLGGEAHEQGRDLQALELRWLNLKAMGVDAVCTDYPSRVSNLIKQ